MARVFSPQTFILIHLSIRIVVKLEPSRSISLSKTRDSTPKRRSLPYSLELSDKYSGDVFEYCSKQWAVFFYYLITKKYPMRKGTHTPEYDMIECRLGLNNHSIAKFQRIFEFERILYVPSRLLPHFLGEHPLAKTLYGVEDHTESAGIQ